MIMYEDYELAYNVYMAEQDLFEDINRLYVSVNESESIVAINEGFKETVMKYVTKITHGIQEAWKKFKGLLTNIKDMKFLKAIKNKVASIIPKFTINNFPKFQNEKLDAIKIVPFNYEEMKDKLKSKEEFLHAYYSSFVTDAKASIHDNMRKYVVPITQNIKCSPEIIKDMFNNLVTFTKKTTGLTKDLETINKSNQATQTALAVVTQAVEPAYNSSSNNDNIIDGDFRVIENYLFFKEADETPKVEYKDDPDAQKQSADQSGSFIKSISIYYSIVAEIVSAKMKLLREQFVFYIQTLKHCIKPDEKKEENNSSNETQGATTNTVPQIDTK